MAIRTGLEGKPWYVGLAIGLGIGVAIYFAAHVWLLKPKRIDLEREETRLTGLQAKIQEGKTAKAELQRFRDEVRRLELELDRLLRILPSRRNTPDLLRRIRTLTEQGDFELLRFAPGDITDLDFYSEWPISVSLRGGYHNLALFFDRISRFSRVINIENLQINSLGGAEGVDTISASFNAKTFLYKDTDEGGEG